MGWKGNWCNNSWEEEDCREGRGRMEWREQRVQRAFYFDICITSCSEKRQWCFKHQLIILQRAAVKKRNE